MSDDIASSSLASVLFVNGNDAFKNDTQNRTLMLMPVKPIISAQNPCFPIKMKLGR